MRERQIETSLGGSPNYNCLHVFCCCVLKMNAQRTKLIGDSHSLLGMRFVQCYSFSCAARTCKPSKRKEETATEPPHKVERNVEAVAHFLEAPQALVPHSGGVEVVVCLAKKGGQFMPRTLALGRIFSGSVAKHQKTSPDSTNPFLFHRPETISV